jgi:hypothetical protein
MLRALRVARRGPDRLVDASVPTSGNVPPGNPVAVAGSGLGFDETRRWIVRGLRYEGRVDGRVGDAREREEEPVHLHHLGARDVGAPLPLRLDQAQRDPLPNLRHPTELADGFPRRPDPPGLRRRSR